MLVAASKAYSLSNLSIALKSPPVVLFFCTKSALLCYRARVRALTRAFCLVLIWLHLSGCPLTVLELHLQPRGSSFLWPAPNQPCTSAGTRANKVLFM